MFHEPTFGAEFRDTLQRFTLVEEQVFAQFWLWILAVSGCGTHRAKRKAKSESGEDGARNKQGERVKGFKQE